MSLPVQKGQGNKSTVNALIQQYIFCRQVERGLTQKGKEWIDNTLPKFDKALAVKGIDLLVAERDDIREFLGSVKGVWMRHSYFRAIRAFYNWAEREGYIHLSPCHKMQAPKLPKPILPHPTLSQVKELIASVPSVRNKAILCLMMDTGFRREEVANIKLKDIDWERKLVKVWGKGAKERVGKLSDTTLVYLREHLETFNPNGGSIWGLSGRGIQAFLRRLKTTTGIPCNPHSFRRSWTIESIKNGTNLLDVQLLGGWESFEMVKRYAREVNSEDAVSRYKTLL